MPFYEYGCSMCPVIITVFHKMDEDIERLCPSCPDGKLEKQISCPFFELKGRPNDGFHDPGMH